MILDLEETFTVGQENFFDSTSPTSSFAVIFEDDLTTAISMRSTERRTCWYLMHYMCIMMQMLLIKTSHPKFKSHGRMMDKLLHY